MRYEVLVSDLGFSKNLLFLSLLKSPSKKDNKVKEYKG